MATQNQFKDWVSVLLAHLLRCPDTVSRASEKVEPKDLAHLVSANLAILWAYSRDYFKEHRVCIPLPFLESKICERISMNEMDGSELDEVADFVHWVYTLPDTSFSYKEAIKLLRQLLSTTRVNEPIKAAIDDGVSMNDLNELVRVGMTAASISDMQVHDPLEDLEGLLSQAAPIPLGGPEILYFNKLCQGGLKPGEVCVLIGPMGGFKTTMMIDVMASMALVCEKAVYAAYEQSFDAGEIRIRFLSRLTGIPRTRIEDLEFKDPTKRTAEEVNKIIEAKKFSSNILWLDRHDKVDYVSDLAAAVHELIQNGHKPELIVIDQLLQWVQRWPECKDPNNIRTVATRTIDAVKKEIAEKFKTRVVVLHQLAAEHLSKDHWFKPKAGQAAEAKGISWWADFEVLLGLMHKEYHCLWAVTGKTRRGSYTELILKADGVNCRMYEAKDMSVDTRTNKFIKAGEENKMPVPTRSGNNATGGFSKKKDF